MAQKLRFGTAERLNYRSGACARRTPSAYTHLIQRCTDAAIAHGLVAHRKQLSQIKANFRRAK